MSTDAPPEQPASDRLDTATAQPSGLFGSPRSTTILAGAVILSVGVFFLSTVRAGHNSGDDFAMYIMHARNIEQGHAYAPTGYIYNPAVPGFGPRVYPP